MRESKFAICILLNRPIFHDWNAANKTYDWDFVKEKFSVFLENQLQQLRRKTFLPLFG